MSRQDFQGLNLGSENLKFHSFIHSFIHSLMLGVKIHKGILKFLNVIIKPKSNQTKVRIKNQSRIKISQNKIKFVSNIKVHVAARFPGADVHVRKSYYGWALGRGVI